MKPTLFITFQGGEWKALVDIHPADPSVGIMEPFPEGIQLWNPQGEEIKDEAVLDSWLDYDTEQGKLVQEQVDRLYYGDA